MKFVIIEHLRRERTNRCVLKLTNTQSIKHTRVMQNANGNDVTVLDFIEPKKLVPSFKFYHHSLAYLLGHPSSMQCSVYLPFEITSSDPLCTIVTPPKALDTSVTIFGSGCTAGGTSPRFRTEVTKLENSTALGVRTALRYPFITFGLLVKCQRPSASITTGMFEALTLSIIIEMRPSIDWFLPSPGPTKKQYLGIASGYGEWFFVRKK